MADESPAQAINQVDQIKKLCDFFENSKIKAAVEQAVPVSMPPEQGSLGFNTPLWAGLGMVGLWAALDAFAERAGLQANCPTCEGRNCIVEAYKSKLQDDTEKRSFAELEDLRHLYAHNYAGEADEEYLRRKRHVLTKTDAPVELSCGATFDGRRLCRQNADLAGQQTGNPARLPPQYALNLSDLRNYAGTVRSVLERFGPGPSS